MMQPYLGAALKLIDPSTGEFLGVLHVPANVDLSRVERYGTDKLPLNLPFTVMPWEMHAFNDAIGEDYILLTRGYHHNAPDAFSILFGKEPHEVSRYAGYAFAPSMEYVRRQLF